MIFETTDLYSSECPCHKRQRTHPCHSIIHNVSVVGTTHVVLPSSLQPQGSIWVLLALGIPCRSPLLPLLGTILSVCLELPIPELNKSSQPPGRSMSCEVGPVSKCLPKVKTAAPLVMELTLEPDSEMPGTCSPAHNPTRPQITHGS